jgi:hypothetical protein
MKSNKITIGLFIYQAVFARTSKPLETKKNIWESERKGYEK